MVGLNQLYTYIIIYIYPHKSSFDSEICINPPFWGGNIHCEMVNDPWMIQSNGRLAIGCSPKCPQSSLRRLGFEMPLNHSKSTASSFSLPFFVAVWGGLIILNYPFSDRPMWNHQNFCEFRDVSMWKQTGNWFLPNFLIPLATKTSPGLSQDRVAWATIPLLKADQRSPQLIIEIQKARGTIYSYS